MSTVTTVAFRAILTNFIFKISGLTKNYIIFLTSKQKWYINLLEHTILVSKTLMYLQYWASTSFVKENPDRSGKLMHCPLGSLPKVVWG